MSRWSGVRTVAAEVCVQTLQECESTAYVDALFNIQIHAVELVELDGISKWAVVLLVLCVMVDQ